MGVAVHEHARDGIARRKRARAGEAHAHIARVMRHEKADALDHRAREPPDRGAVLGEIVVAEHRHDRRDGLKFVQNGRAADVAGVNDQVDPEQSRIGAGIERAVRVGYDADGLHASHDSRRRSTIANTRL